jgi:hypothetical protein
VDTSTITTPSRFSMSKDIENNVREFMMLLDIPEGEVPETSRFH